MERFLTIQNVREMLGVSRSTLWRWTAENGLKIVRIGNVTRIRESDLKEFLTRHETSGANAQHSQADVSQPS
jgi:excisionase family DNA binding protein